MVEITARTVVNDAVREVPGALAILTACGIDTCCGGVLPIGEAAARHGLDTEALLARLREGAESASKEGAGAPAAVKRA